MDVSLDLRNSNKKRSSDLDTNAERDQEPPKVRELSSLSKISDRSVSPLTHAK